MIKAVIFDLDGTLLDRDTSLSAFIESQYDRLNEVLKHIPRKQFCDRFIELDAKGYVWKDQVYAQLAKEYAIQGISPEELLKDYLKNFAIHCQPFPHLIAMLEALKRSAFRLGIITNGRGQFQLDNIQALNIASYFDVLLISEWEGLKKPDSAIFQRALEKLGVLAEEAVYIGDHPKNDIQAAKTAGILGIWKRDPFWEPEPSGLSIESLSEIPDLIDKMNLLVRPYRPEDLEVLVDLFYETVHTVNAAQYTPEQLNAWAPLEEKEGRIEKWRDSLSRNFSFVAEQAGKIVGFSDLQKDGYLNRLYIHKDYQRQGIAAALLNAVEKEAEKLALSEITVDASLTAKPFFEKHGYETIRQQTVVRKGVALINFKMVKTMY